MSDEARTVRKVVSFSASEWKRIDDWMYEARVRVEAEAIRRLIEVGLRASEAGARDETGKDGPMTAIKAAE
jgi:hypothetical protein